MSSSRRHFLTGSSATLGAVLSGCASFDTRNPEDTPTGTPKQSPTTHEPATTTPGPVTADDFAFDARLLNDFTKDQPARLEVVFTNVANGPVTLAGHEILPFSEYAGTHEHGDARVLLVPDDHHWMTPDDDGTPVNTDMIPDDPRDGCWTVEYEGVAVTLTTVLGEIPAEESISHRFTLLDWNNESCLPTGSYMFSQQQSLYRGGIEERDPLEASITLGFSIHIDSNRTLSVAVHEPSIAPP